MIKYCASCGTPNHDGGRFCATCGSAVNLDPLAPETAGEICFEQTIEPASEVVAAVGLLKNLAGGMQSLVKGFVAAFRDKKRWIPAVVLAVIWLVLTILPLLGIDTPLIRRLSLATFAGGGTTGGYTGLVGGVFGKGIFAYFLFSLVLPIGRGQKPFAGVWSGLSRLFPSLAVKNRSEWPGVLTGLGLALICFNFMTGEVSLQNSMVGVAAFFLSLRALSRPSGFLSRLTSSLTTLFKKDKRVNPDSLRRVLAGWTVGFVLALPLSTLPWAWSGYAAGGLMMFLAGVLKITVSSQRRVTA